MNDLQLFNSPEFGQIRAVTINNEPYFIGNDVALALGYEKPRNAIIRHVDEDDALKQGVADNLGRIQETALINESGLYSLVFGSKLSTAKAFKRWITHDVLPTLRKTGSYHIKKAPARRKRTPALTTKVKASLLWIEGVSKTLNLIKNQIFTIHTFAIKPNGTREIGFNNCTKAILTFYIRVYLICVIIIAFCIMHFLSCIWENSRKR